MALRDGFTYTQLTNISILYTERRKHPSTYINDYTWGQIIYW